MDKNVLSTRSEMIMATGVYSSLTLVASSIITFMLKTLIPARTQIMRITIPKPRTTANPDRMFFTTSLFPNYYQVKSK